MNENFYNALVEALRNDSDVLVVAMMNDEVIRDLVEEQITGLVEAWIGKLSDDLTVTQAKKSEGQILLDYLKKFDVFPEISSSLDPLRAKLNSWNARN